MSFSLILHFERARTKKTSVEELEKRLEDIRKLVNKYKGELGETIKRRPMESTGIILIAGLVLGLLIGSSGM